MQIESVWARYVAAEESGDRKAALAFLYDVIGVACSLPENERVQWARERARDAVDRRSAPPVRFTFFVEVLFPALASGIESGEPGCARWLAGFSDLLCQAPECLERMEPYMTESHGLLRVALRADQNDVRTRAMLIDEMRDSLEYSLHEVPSGVLGEDGNAATIEQCRELRADLEEFERLVTVHGTFSEHSELIERCRLHYRAYSVYLARRGEFGRSVE